jgi:hypothetical protein
MSTAPVSERVSEVAGLQSQRTSRIWLCSDERLTEKAQTCLCARRRSAGERPRSGSSALTYDGN